MIRTIASYTIMILLIFSCSSSGEAEKKPVAQASGMEKFQKVTAEADQIEYVFYVPEGSVTTQTDEKQVIAQYGSFISEKTFPSDRNCKFDGGIVFRKGDEITGEMDFVLTEDCRHVRLRLDNKYYYHEWTEKGLQAVFQFLKMISSANQPQGQ